MQDMLLYRKSVLYFLVFLIFGTLSLGRAFSVFSPLRLFGLPFYITDVFILFSLPLAMKGFWDLRRLPGWFYAPFSLLFFLAEVYLFHGLLIDHSPYALRSAVLSVYLLFVPVVWFMFKRAFRPEYFLVLLVLANVGSVIFGAGIGPQVWLANTRGFNLTLFYGVTIAFLLPFGLECLTDIRSRWLVWGITGINVFMVINGCVRSSWAALIVLLVFYILIFRSKWKALIIAYGMIMISVGSLLLLQGVFVREGQLRFVQRTQGTFYFITQTLDRVKALSRKSYVDKHGLGAKDFVLENAETRDIELENAAEENAAEENAQDIMPLSEAAGNAYSNMTWRIGVWKATFSAGMKSPLWGNGFSKLLIYDQSLVTAEIRGPGADSGIVPPHNEFLTVFYRMGLIGIVLFVWINGFVFWRGLRRLGGESDPICRACLAGALGALVVWHIAAQFFDLIDSPPTNIILWMLLGLVLVLLYGRDIERAEV